MSELAGAVVMMAVEGFCLSQDELKFFDSAPFAGVTLFARNIPEPHVRVVELITKLQSLNRSSEPLIIAVDQEGGRVSRLKGDFPNDGPAQHLVDGRFDAEALTQIFSYAASVGQNLAQLGFNVNFAPVLDVLTEPSNVAIGDRVFGTQPEIVHRRAGAFLDGLQSAGVLGCLKHFPGQGAALVDTHVGSAYVDRSASDLDDIDILPFKVLASRAPMIMLSHCIYTELDDKPASCSEVVVRKILRDQVGFEGVVVSDDMTMGAMPDNEKEWGEVNVEAIAAGVDLLLVCRHIDRCRLAVEALAQEARRSKAFATRLTDAADQVYKLRKRLAYQI